MGEESDSYLEHGYQPTNRVDPPLRPKTRPQEQHGQQPVDYVPPKGAPQEPGGTVAPKPSE